MVAHKAPNRAVLEVGGLGFDLSITTITSGQLPAVGDTAKVYTDLIVREDNLSLYGFATMLERTVFSYLLDVGGIGPRTAQAVLSSFTASAFIQAVLSGDEAALRKVSGVGKKTAQRILLELRDKLRQLGQEADVPMSTGAEPDLAVAALLQLGYTDGEVQLALGQVQSDADTAQRVKAALEVLRKR